MRSKSRISKMAAIFLTGLVIMLILVVIFNQISPDGFADRIQSLSPNYYNTLGAPARTWPKYEEEQRFNIRALSNTGIVASDTEIPVITGPHGLRLNTLVGKLG